MGEEEGNTVMVMEGEDPPMEDRHGIPSEGCLDCMPCVCRCEKHRSSVKK